LSGGNQQKVVLAKWLARTPELLIVDEPTRGIDIGTKSEVHRLISQLATEGVAVLVISSELPEVLTVADRVLVMREGQLAARLDRAEATEESIVAAGTATVGEAR
jgi:rhamnose transport system ATP-binding protein